MFFYYFVGALSLVAFCLITWFLMGNPNPFALIWDEDGAGGNGNASASRLQMVVFTMLTVFAYSTVAAARIYAHGGKGLLPSLENGNEWLGVPTNLLILMGITVGSTVASRAIRTQQAANGTLSLVDESSLTQARDGKTDLVKIQMLIWTAIALFIYLQILWRYMLQGCYIAGAAGCPEGWGNTLPDIDTAFLALLGISQGGYVVNQLSDTNKP